MLLKHYLIQDILSCFVIIKKIESRRLRNINYILALKNVPSYLLNGSAFCPPKRLIYQRYFSIKKINREKPIYVNTPTYKYRSIFLLICFGAFIIALERIISRLHSNLLDYFTVLYTFTGNAFSCDSCKEWQYPEKSEPKSYIYWFRRGFCFGYSIVVERTTLSCNYRSLNNGNLRVNEPVSDDEK